MKQACFPTPPAIPPRRPPGARRGISFGWFLALQVLTGVAHGEPRLELEQPPGSRLRSQVVAWGSNSSGESDVPAGLGGVVAIAAGRDHSVALTSDGEVIAWGWNPDGQTTIPAGLGAVASVAAGSHHTLALKNDGSVVAWGRNGDGQASVPSGLDGVIALAAGEYHSLALKSNGTVVAWGNTSPEFRVPSGLKGITAVAAASRSTMALRDDGRVVAWGWSYDPAGQNTVPSGLVDVVSVVAGGGHGVALKGDGTVAAWGDNRYGQSDVPDGLSGVLAIAAGDEHTLALKRDGTLVGWGSNYQGQLAAPDELMGVTGICAHGKRSLAMQRLVGFPDQPVGGPGSAQTFSVRNAGSDPLIVQEVTVSGPGADGFRVETDGMPQSVPAAGGSVPFTVTFAPRSGGVNNALLRLVTNDPTQGSFGVALRGRGLGPEIQVVGNNMVLTNHDDTPSVLDDTDFGRANISGHTVVRTFTIASVGTAPLELTGTPVVTLAGAHPDDFTATALPIGSVPATNGSTSLQISFTPVQTGVRTATVRIATNDDDEDPFVFSIQGTGVVEPEIEVGHPQGEPLGSDFVAWGANDVGQTNIPVGQTGVVAISAGHAHTLALKQDGRVIAWGDNSRAQRTIPAGLTNVIAVAAGTWHSVALKSDGSVAAWGDNTYGQTTIPAGLLNVTAIAAGGSRTLAVKADGTVLAWGDQTTGQYSAPAGLAGVAAVALSYNDAVALGRDGRIVAWGQNTYGELNAPAGLTQVKAIATSGAHTLALKRDGTVVGWGDGSYGRLAVPAGLSGVTAIAVAGGHNLALNSDHTVVAWGATELDQVTVPAGLKDVAAISTGSQFAVALQRTARFGNQAVGTTSALKSFSIQNLGNGPLGINGVGLLGDDAADFTLDAAGVTPTIAAFGGSTTFTVAFNPKTGGPRRATLRIINDDANEGHFDISLIGTGIGSEIDVVGNNRSIPNGLGEPSLDTLTDFGHADGAGGMVARTFTITNTGAAALSLTGTPRVAIGGAHAEEFTVTTEPGASIAPLTGTSTFRVVFVPAALGRRAAIVTIASNDHDEPSFTFAIGGTGVIPPEIAIDQPPATGQESIVVAWGRNLEGQTDIPIGLADVVAVEAGRYHNLALKADLSVVAWGGNEYGQAKVPGFGLDYILTIAAGDYHSLALESYGFVAGWGRNDNGEARHPPGLENVAALAAGRSHNLALRTDGKVSAWGANGSGQATVPPALVDVTAIAAGYAHSVVLKSDGKVQAWGSNAYGQTSIPAGLAGVKAIAAGHYHTLALKNDGTVVAWGRNDFGQRIVPVGLEGVKAIAADFNQSLALTIDGGVVAWGANESGQSTVPLGLRPVTAIAAGGYHTLVLQPGLFGNQALATTSLPKIFTIENSGNGPLAILGVEVVEGDVDDFVVDTGGMSSSVPALTGSTSFAVRFTPGAVRPRRATLRVLSDDLDEGAFDILLTGSGVLATSYEIWADSASLSGQSAPPHAAPHGDGVVNLLKYAFNLDGAGPDASLLTPGTGTRGLPVAFLAGNETARVLHVEFVRRRNQGLLYTPQVSASLDVFVRMTGLPSVTPIDADWERVVIEEPLSDPLPPGIFSRVLVSLP